MRIPKKLFIFLAKKVNLSFFPYEIDRIGIWFYWKGDQICLRWFWRKGRRFLSILADGEFNSLKEIDQFWIDFEKACQRHIW